MCVSQPSSPVATAILLHTHARKRTHARTHTHAESVKPPKLISQTCDFQFQTGDTNPALNIHAESGWETLRSHAALAAVGWVGGWEGWVGQEMCGGRGRRGGF